MRTFWTSLVLAHHRIAVEHYTEMRIHATTLQIAGLDTAKADRHTRRAVFRLTAQNLQFTHTERLYFCLSLWFSTRLKTPHTYIPPSAHDILGLTRQLHDARRTRIGLLRIPLDRLSLG